MKLDRPDGRIVITFIVCSILSLRVSICSIPAWPSLVLVPVLYLALRRHWDVTIFLPFHRHCVASWLRLVVMLVPLTLYATAWFQSVLVGGGPDSGGSFAVFFKQADYYLHACGYPRHTFATLSMVAAWAIPGFVVIGSVLLQVWRPSLVLRRVYLVGALFSFLMPLWQWGPAGVSHAAAGLLAFLSISRFQNQEMETAPTTASTTTNGPAAVGSI